MRPNEKAEEWAIRDEATGEWFLGDFKHPWVIDPPHRYASYSNACEAIAGLANLAIYRTSARIVPAPPKEMKDAEAWEWFKTLGRAWAIIWNGSKWVAHRYYASDMSFINGIGDTPCGAIRAAHRALENK